MMDVNGAYVGYVSWIRGVAARRTGFGVLFAIAFAEGALIPLSVDIPLLALALARRTAALRFGIVAVAGSCLGACAGYAIGVFLYDQVGASLIQMFGLGGDLSRILPDMAGQGIWTVISAGFIPIPFFLVSIAAGWSLAIDPLQFAVGVLVGRTIRFMPIAVIILLFGDRAERLINRYRLLFLVFGCALLLVAVVGIFRQLM